MMALRSAALAAALLPVTLLSPAHAQGIGLSMTGGGAGKVTKFTLEGTPGDPYLLLYDFQETTTALPHITLDISLFFLPVAVTIPGFLGGFPANGTASTSFVIPAGDPALLDSTITFQALGGAAIDKVSERVRLTPAMPGTFEATLGAPALPVVGGAVYERDDGSLLLIGGSGPLAQSYAPNLEEFAVEGPAFGVGLLGQSTALADGRFLFTGGLGLDGQPTAAAAVYDPATGQTVNLTMNAARAGHGASLLPNGRVLVSGGFQSLNPTDLLSLLLGIQGSSELFDPTTMTFSFGPAMLEPRALHTSTALNNGNVLVAGGLSVIPIVNIPTVSTTAYEYSAALNTFGLPKVFSGARLLHSATRLADGRVLLVGGLSLDLTAVLQSGDITQLKIDTLADGQIYTPGFFGGFQAATGALSVGRAGAGMVTLPNGDVLVAGGIQATISAAQLDVGALATADLFSVQGGFSATGSMAGARFLPVMHVLRDGTALVLGGGPTTAEVYQP